MYLRKKLAYHLEPRELGLVSSSYDIIGDIAVVRMSDKVSHKASDIAEAIMEKNGHVRTVLRQTSPVAGELRLRDLKWVAGEKKTETVHREFGCKFKVDLQKCYFSPRLSFERMRIARQISDGETIINMFAGVGCFSIIIAKYSTPKKVHSIDINPSAVEFMKENIRINRVQNIVQSFQGDAKEIIEKSLRQSSQRVLMPLPEKASEYLESALLALTTGRGIIHYYDFESTSEKEEPGRKTMNKIREKLTALDLKFEFLAHRIVRSVGPRWFQVVIDVLIYRKR